MRPKILGGQRVTIVSRAFQVGSQLTGTQAGTFLDSDPVTKGSPATITTVPPAADAPEPGSSVLLGLGVCVMWIGRWKTGKRSVWGGVAEPA